MNWLKITLSALVVWRITHLMTYEDGPWQVLHRMRRMIGPGFLGQLVECFYCLSLYVSAPLACCLTHAWKERLLLWPALSAGAILFQERTTRHGLRIQDLYVEDAIKNKEEDHVLR